MATKTFCDFCLMEKEVIVIEVEGEPHPHNGVSTSELKDVCVPCVKKKFGRLRPVRG